MYAYVCVCVYAFQGVCVSVYRLACVGTCILQAGSHQGHIRRHITVTSGLVCVSVCVSMFLPVCVFVCLYIYVSVSVCVCLSVCVSAYVCICHMYVGVCMCMCICIPGCLCVSVCRLACVGACIFQAGSHRGHIRVTIDRPCSYWTTLMVPLCHPQGMPHASYMRLRWHLCRWAPEPGWH